MKQTAIGKLAEADFILFFGKFIRFPFISRVLLFLVTAHTNYQLKLSTETLRCTEESRSADNERLITQEHIHSLLITDPGQQKPVVLKILPKQNPVLINSIKHFIFPPN